MQPRTDNDDKRMPQLFEEYKWLQVSHHYKLVIS